MASFIPTAAMAAVQIGVEAAQRNQQAAAARAAQDAQARFQIEQIRQQQMIEQKQRQKVLKEALASQRARFGSQGIGLGGSADAVLNGLTGSVTERNRQARDLTELRVGQIESGRAWSARRNLLDTSQPTFRSALKLAQKGLQTLPLMDF